MPKIRPHSGLSPSQLQEWLQELPQSGLEYEVACGGIWWSDPRADQPARQWLRAPLMYLQDEELAYPQILQRRLQSPEPALIILMQAGMAALALVRGEQVLGSRIVRRYMVRKSQGKAQYSYLQQRGKSRLGSRIRLQQTKKFFQDVNSQLHDWLRREPSIERIFLSCGPRLKGLWYGEAQKPPIDKKDPRWQRIPLSLGDANQDELQRVHQFLLTATIES